MNPDIATRMLDYFARQIALFEELEAHLQSLPKPDDTERWSAIAQREVEDRKRITQLEEEFALLSQEWNATDRSGSERYEEVHAQAARAKELADRLEARYDVCAESARSAANATAKDLKGVQVGKQLLEGYNPGSRDKRGARIDSQA